MVLLNVRVKRNSLLMKSVAGTKCPCEISIPPSLSIPVPFLGGAVRIAVSAGGGGILFFRWIGHSGVIERGSRAREERGHSSGIK